jgi:hypothetical protein
VPDAIPVWTDPDGTYHEWFTYAAFVRGELLGEWALDPGAHPKTGYSRSGHAFFCPSCGEIWGTITATNSQGVVQAFDVVKVACERHYDQWNTPGSLLAVRGFDALLEFLPNVVLKREFIMNLKHYKE